MVHAIVLLEAERHRINDLAQELLALPGVAEVYSVAGPWDLVAMVRVPSNDEVAELVTGRLLQLEGVRRSETLIAFRTYSRHDLERMFGVGLDA
ncbi:MAG: Lrp/AsnC family transcriptional regulator [Thermoanaerobaculia bacterium]|nr:Lrp/AsnC family transcriptional regulator [Thermoanaerobaculia bacterium]MCZ7652877.1 Lrp/AsnC ligand binding domain-containing protein [Thermoanaerobaculia bacterium]